MAGESAREAARRARERAARLQRRAEMFEQGAEGEAATALVLASLPKEWVAVHDVRWPGRRFANVDHVLLGPGGIFVIDSKNWTGRVEVRDGRLRQNGRSRDKYVAGAADAALAVAELVGPYADQVHPVLCFVGQDGLSGWCRDVMVCSTTNLVQMLTTRPVVLAPDESTDAWFRLDARLRAATGPTARAAKAARVPVQTRRVPAPRAASARSRKKQPSLVGFLVTLMMLAGLLLFGQQLATAFGALIAEQMTEDVGDGRCPGEADC